MWQIVLSAVLCKRSVAVVLRHLVLLSGGDSVTQRPRCDKVESSDRNSSMSGLYFADRYDPQKREVMINEKN